jgi:hypothetical protein
MYFNAQHQINDMKPNLTPCEFHWFVEDTNLEDQIGSLSSR